MDESKLSRLEELKKAKMASMGKARTKKEAAERKKTKEEIEAKLEANRQAKAAKERAKLGPDYLDGRASSEEVLTSQDDVLWKPISQVQIDFLSSSEDEVLFCGGRGSGKSDCLMVDPLRSIHNKNFRGLIIRRTMGELRELIKRGKDLYPKFAPGTKWKGEEKLFLFPSGATIEFGYCDNTEDLERYRGQQYTWIGVDELTQFDNPDMVDILCASLRTTDKTLNTYFRATTNPSGKGTRWVKARWVDIGEPGKTLLITSKVFEESYTVSRKWFNSTIHDNPVLMEADPLYVARLANQSNEVLKRQWLYGEWVTEGVAFDEFNRRDHVVKPFKIPHSWYKFRACDWGYTSMAACLWIALDSDYNMYVYREYATRLETADIFGANLLRLEEGDRISLGVLDSSVWSKRGEVGETPAETMNRMGLNWMPSDRSNGARIAGKLLLHRWLAKDASTGEPRLKIFSTCKELISELENLQLDSSNTEDVNTKLKDHAYDALRYALLYRPDLMSSSFYEDFSSTYAEDSPIDDFFGY